MFALNRKLFECFNEDLPEDLPKTALVLLTGRMSERGKEEKKTRKSRSANILSTMLLYKSYLISSSLASGFDEAELLPKHDVTANKLPGSSPMYSF